MKIVTELIVDPEVKLIISGLRFMETATEKEEARRRIRELRFRLEREVNAKAQILSEVK